MAETQWIDISVSLRDAMVYWPGDPPISIRRVQDMEQGDTAHLSMVSMGAHSGTHIDAPIHFIQQGAGVDKMPLDATVGQARVIEIRDSESIKPEELLRHHIRRGEVFCLRQGILRMSGGVMNLSRILYLFQTKLLASLQSVA